jgi:hypothetical protein
LHDEIPVLLVESRRSKFVALLADRYAKTPRVINLNVDAFDSVDLVGDGTNIPLVDESVDTVTCNAVIEHVCNPVDLVFPGQISGPVA